MSGITPSQTVGPYFGIMLRGRAECRQVTDATSGTRIVIEGQVFDGSGNVISDALVETWQVDPPSNVHFNGYGWAHTGEDGGFRFETVKPGRVPGPDGSEQAPHILVSVMARGILTRFITRIYFEDDVSNADDPILALVPHERRHTLIARRVDEGRYLFNLVMQGAGETVFFDV
jgi:protocatechuate 3,4-dioxygenase, alpha subunit